MAIDPLATWKSDRWIVAILFLLSSIVSDLFFFLLWRQLPVEELYHVSTLAAYIMVFIMPFIVEAIAKRFVRLQKMVLVTKYDELGTALAVVICFIATLYCVRFW